MNIPKNVIDFRGFNFDDSLEFSSEELPKRFMVLGEELIRIPSHISEWKYAPYEIRTVIKSCHKEIPVGAVILFSRVGKNPLFVDEDSQTK